MTATVFIDINNKVARAAQTGEALPSVKCRLLAYLKIIVKFFDGDDLVEIDADTAKLVVKAKDDPTSAPALLDTTAALVTGPAYEFVFDPADSSALRTVLDAQAEPYQTLEMRAEIEYELDGKIERVAFPIYFDTAYNRPDDAAPDTAESASEAWLSDRALRFDESQTLALAEKWQALNNAGITFVRGCLRIVTAEGAVVHFAATSGEPPDL